MRTRALIVSGLLGLLGATTSSLLAQNNIFSLNTISYLNVVTPPGFSILVNQLNSTNNNITNLFPNTTALATGPYAGNGPYDYCTIFVFLPIGNYSVFYGDYGDPGNGYCGWGDVVGNTNAVIKPGQGFWFLNNQFSPALSITNTFAGTVMQGSLTNWLNPGFNMVGSIVPQTGGLGTVLGLAPTGIQDGQQDGGDTLFLFINQHYQIYYEEDGYSTPPASPLYWDGPSSNSVTPANFTTTNNNGTTPYIDPNLPPLQVGGTEIEPIISVGQGFWYYLTKDSAHNSSLSWSRIFSVNN